MWPANQPSEYGDAEEHSSLVGQKTRLMLRNDIAIRRQTEMA
jgi:hypothetical protein